MQKAKRKWLQRVASAVVVASTSTALWADYSHNPQAIKLIDSLVSEHGLDRAKLELAFRSAQKEQSVLDLMSKPAEKVLEWKDYRPIFLNDRQINGGVKFWNQHAETLARAEKEFGVPAQVIVAIIGVETRYGRIKGKYRVIDALSTLSFDYPRRAKFFQKELTQFLLLTHEHDIDPLKPVGSYAGAMGYGQFMPSSFRAYAVDFTGSGYADIWNSADDAIGSVANYLSKHGWQKGEPVAVRAHVKGKEFDQGVRTALKPKQTVAELKELGWDPLVKLPAKTPVRGLRLEGALGAEYWATLNNFYVITRYNQSSMYALAVEQLGQAIAEKREARASHLAKKVSDNHGQGEQG